MKMTYDEYEAKLKQAEETTDEKFGKVMDSLFNLAEELHERDELTETEKEFLDAFDAYVDAACELNELEESMNQ
jgi:GTP cyclohydrolase I